MAPMAKSFSQLDLNLLRTLVALHRTRSVTAAGQAMALSQPATSNALARLRVHFGDALFVRTPGGLVCTPLAARLAPAVARHLELLEGDLSAPAGFDPATSTRTWRLSLSDLGEMVFLPAIANAVLSAAPLTGIVNAATSTATLGEALAQREVDLAIGILDARRGGLRSIDLFSETYVALSHPERVPRQRTREALARFGCIVASPMATFHGGAEASLRKAGLGDRIVVRTRHFAAMPELVRGAPLVGIVPGSWARELCRRSELIWWPLPLAQPEYAVRLVWHGVSEGDQAVDWLRLTVSGLFGRANRG